MEYTLENYKKGLAEIENEATVRKNKLAREFAEANNPFKEGDIITDGVDTLEIKSFKVSLGWGNTLPEIVCYGVELKKDGTPKIRQSRICIYQSSATKK